MNAARACVTLALVLVSVAAAPPDDRSGERLLGRIKAAYRAHPRPPFVVYTLQRRDVVNGQWDMMNSYGRKIWCRTSDRNALIRDLWRDRANGGMRNERLAFDEASDPGPPTIDVFAPAALAKALPEPAVSPGLPTIGGVTAVAEFDYRVRDVRREGDVLHLQVEPIRDRARSRIDDIWVDAATDELRRIRARDHLYFGLSTYNIPEEFDMQFAQRDGYVVITSIHADGESGVFQSDYTFGSFTFPATLPDWYFQPQTYGAHRAEAPG